MTPSKPLRKREGSSFRDNRGFVYWEDASVYRQINDSGRQSYDTLMGGGLYQELVDAGLLIRHVEEHERPAGGYLTIRPEHVAVISYPYEWSFSQLQDAALATLEIQRRALARGMTLRDASAYNIQFIDGRPVLIDTLSFDVYKPGEPWVAYRQFCQHFLAPLTLMGRVDLDLGQLMRIYIDGVPLPLAAKLLRWRDRTKFGLATHLVMHARLQKQHEGVAKKPQARITATGMAGLIDSLERTIKSLTAPKPRTQWGDYYDHTNYNQNAFDQKTRIVADFLEQVKPKRVLDLGANDGSFSRLAQEKGALVLSCDVDPVAVESNYQQMKAAREHNFVPLLIDLTNPSAALGWANDERASFSARAKSDCVLNLALIHHLAIANNLPLAMVADYCASLGSVLIIEFVPKSDSQVQRLLATREDIFDDYTPEGFEKAFGARYEITAKRPVEGSERLLYLMTRKDQA